MKLLFENSVPGRGMDILPPLDVMLISGISLVALVLEHYSGPRAETRNWPVVAVLNAVTFALLPLAAGLLTGQDLIRFALVGCLVCTAQSRGPVPCRSGL